MTATQQFIDTKYCEICVSRIVRDKKLSQKQWNRKKYCSFKCGGIALRERNGKSPWNKGLKCPQIGGENHHLWKGGITPLNEIIRKSFEYKEWRRHVFQRDDWTCQGCGTRGGNLHADHVLPFSTFIDLRFEVLNGRTLCKECHRKTDTYGHKIKTYELN